MHRFTFGILALWLGRLLMGGILALTGSVPTSSPTEVLLKAGPRVIARAPLAADGTFRFDNVAAGDYDLEIHVGGRPHNTAVAGTPGALRVAAPRGRGTTGSADPGDGGTGQASGQRLPAPNRIIKEWGPSSPRIEAAVDGDTISGRATINTTRSNIKRQG